MGSSHFSNQDLENIYQLLADEDQTTFSLLQPPLMKRDFALDTMLERAARDSNPVRSQNALNLLQQKFGAEAEKSFVEFLAQHRGTLDLAEALIHLSSTEYPRIDSERYRDTLAQWTAHAKELCSPKQDTETNLVAFHKLFFEQLGLTGNEADYYDPRNSYLFDVIDRRIGSPIALCSLYLILGQQIGLPLVGVGMPGHFLVRFQSPRYSTFIDVFNQGKELNKEECMAYCHKAGYGYMSEYLSPVTPRGILARTCCNLMLIYADNQDQRKVHRFQKFLVELGSLPTQFGE
jgi:regulator of sirC expression with transglutaminase-like and TPR domain